MLYNIFVHCYNTIYLLLYSVNLLHCLLIHFYVVLISSYNYSGSYNGFNAFNVSCVGSEQELLNCSHSTRTASCSRTVAVNCNSSCTHGDMRLVGGRTPSEGRMEVCVNGLWKIVCDSSFGTNDVKVACRHLGFTNHSGK